jgi:hypothetical protein
LAPIFIRIKQIQITNGELSTVLNCYPEAELDLVKMIIFNRETKEDSMFMDDFIKNRRWRLQPDQTIPYNFSKFRLYHNGDLIDFHQRSAIL